MKIEVEFPQGKRMVEAIAVTNWSNESSRSPQLEPKPMYGWMFIETISGWVAVEDSSNYTAKDSAWTP